MRSYSDLPQEIISDIISRLPAKSVGLCRCVSKSWLILLCQPSFIKTHLQMTKINSLESLAIVGCAKHESFIYSAPLNNGHRKITLSLTLTKLSFGEYYLPFKYDIYGSCDGLLLVHYNYYNMMVMNLVTREIRQVHLLSIARSFITTFGLFGFGYDSVRDDYKIVIVCRNGKTKETFVDVYSLKNGLWKTLKSSPYDYAVESHKPQGAFVDGCLHWLDGRTTTDNKHAIVSFNLVNEKFREVPHPSLILDDLLVDYKLDVLGGCLCMYCLEKNDEIWVMKEYGVLESWTKLTMNNPYGKFKCFLKHREQVVMGYDHDDYVMWNVKQGTLKKINVLNGFKGVQYRPNDDASFVESLVSPHGSNK